LSLSQENAIRALEHYRMNLKDRVQEIQFGLVIK
jgi:hypothetical protein